MPTARWTCRPVPWIWPSSPPVNLRLLPCPPSWPFPGVNSANASGFSGFWLISVEFHILGEEKKNQKTHKIASFVRPCGQALPCPPRGRTQMAAADSSRISILSCPNLWSTANQMKIRGNMDVTQWMLHNRLVEVFGFVLNNDDTKQPLQHCRLVAMRGSSSPDFFEPPGGSEGHGQRTQRRTPRFFVGSRRAGVTMLEQFLQASFCR